MIVTQTTTTDSQPIRGRFEVIWRRKTERGSFIESSPSCTYWEAKDLFDTVVAQFSKDQVAIEIWIACHDVKVDNEPLHVCTCVIAHDVKKVQAD